MDSKEWEEIKEKIERVENFGHGEVIVKIKNKHIHRILVTEDELYTKTK